LRVQRRRLCRSIAAYTTPRAIRDTPWLQRAPRKSGWDTQWQSRDGAAQRHPPLLAPSQRQRAREPDRWRGPDKSAAATLFDSIRGVALRFRRVSAGGRARRCGLDERPRSRAAVGRHRATYLRLRLQVPQAADEDVPRLRRRNTRKPQSAACD
jgi:hypothetical protein